jgi:Sec-independent protein translocase protein TatA
MSLSRKTQMKMIVKQMRKPVKKLPAIPSTAAQLLDRRRQLLEEVADAADERHEEQERDHQHRDGRAEHGNRGRQAA